MIYSVTYLSIGETRTCDKDECLRSADILVCSITGDDDCLMCRQHWLILRIRLLRKGHDIVGDPTMRKCMLKRLAGGLSWSVYPCQVKRRAASRQRIPSRGFHHSSRVIGPESPFRVARGIPTCGPSPVLQPEKVVRL